MGRPCPLAINSFVSYDFDSPGQNLKFFRKVETYSARRSSLYRWAPTRCGWKILWPYDNIDLALSSRQRLERNYSNQHPPITSELGSKKIHKIYLEQKSFIQQQKTPGARLKLMANLMKTNILVMKNNTKWGTNYSNVCALYPNKNHGDKLIVIINRFPISLKRNRTEFQAQKFNSVQTKVSHV